MEGLKRFSRSFNHAIDGLLWAVRHEKNFRIELIIGFFVLLFVLIFKVKNWEAIVMLLMIMWVLVLELVNTVLERVVDILKPRIHPYARLIKDLMAGVVLISASVSILIGILIFYPYVRELLILVRMY